MTKREPETLPAVEEEERTLDDALQKTFGENFRAARLRAGMTQVQVAEISGFDQTKISKIERGEVNLTLKNVYRLAQAVGHQASLLLESKFPAQP